MEFTTHDESSSAFYLPSDLTDDEDDVERPTANLPETLLTRTATRPPLNASGSPPPPPALPFPTEPPLLHSSAAAVDQTPAWNPFGSTWSVGADSVAASSAAADSPAHPAPPSTMPSASISLPGPAPSPDLAPAPHTAGKSAVWSNSASHSPWSSVAVSSSAFGPSPTPAPHTTHTSLNPATWSAPLRDTTSSSAASGAPPGFLLPHPSDVPTGNLSPIQPTAAGRGRTQSHPVPAVRRSSAVAGPVPQPAQGSHGAGGKGLGFHHQTSGGGSPQPPTSPPTKLLRSHGASARHGHASGASSRTPQAGAAAAGAAAARKTDHAHNDEGEGGGAVAREIPGLAPEKTSRSTRRRNNQRAKQQQSSRQVSKPAEPVAPRTEMDVGRANALTHERRTSSDNLVNFASKRIEEARERWANELAAAAETEAKVQPIRNRSRTGPVSESPTSGAPHASTKNGHGGGNRGRRRGRDELGSGGQGAAEGLGAGSSSGTAHGGSTSSRRPGAGRDARSAPGSVASSSPLKRLAPSRAKARTACVKLMSKVYTRLAGFLGLVIDSILAILAVARRLHRHALTCFLSDSQVAFCMLFLYAFPFIVGFLDNFAPPWAAGCLWYGFLIQNCSSQGGNSQGEWVSRSRLVYLLLFVFDGIGYSSRVAELNGSERLLLAYALITLRTGATFKALCLLSSAAQVLILLVWPGSALLSQWVLILLTTSTLPVPPLLFPGNGSDRTTQCIVIDGSEHHHNHLHHHHHGGVDNAKSALKAPSKI